MKAKNTCAIICFLVGLFCIYNTYGQNQHYKKDPIDTFFPSVLKAEAGDLFDTILIPRVVLNDTVFEYLISEMLQKEKICPYYTDSSSISIDIVMTMSNKFRILISLWDLELLAWTGPSAFFTVGNRTGFLFADKTVLDSSALFSETGCKTHFFCNRSALYRNLMTDDSRSEYYYWLVDKKWYYGEAKHCGEFRY